MRLPNDVIDSVHKAKVTVYYADRRLTSVWNSERMSGEPIHYGGWFWYRSEGRYVVDTDKAGPFKTRSAALRDAYHRLQLKTKG